MKKNILVLSAGRRVELVQAFQKESTALNISAQVFAADLNPKLSSACQIADKFFAVPRVTAENYMDELSKICLHENIGLVVPTIDTELLVLARHREAFAKQGVTLVISDVSLIEKCRDKRRTNELFADLGANVAKIYNVSDIQFPCFVKPYDGSSSIGAMKALKKEDLSEDTLKNPKMIFMEYIDHTQHAEYTVDMYFDRQSQLQCLVPRKRLETRSGEVSKGVTRKNALYDYLKKRFQHVPGARGCLTVQFFFNESTEKAFGIEINPRFGGGYPLTYAAGANYPGWLLKEYFENGKVSFFEQWEKDLLMLRYDAKVLTHDFT